MCCCCFSSVDVKSWLVMFGFQLSNIIPGFPRHTMYFVDPPYELLASQDSDHSRVRHLTFTKTLH